MGFFKKPKPAPKPKPKGSFRPSSGSLPKQGEIRIIYHDPPKKKK